VNGLRIFIDERTIQDAGAHVFYSRRSEGPYYRWCYEQEPNKWRAARVHGNRFSTDTLCIWRWKDVPAALKTSLIDHYSE
jgi:hypothetical protein